ncbi:hypothetical protein ACS0TY_003633 [Phlomoides rotata]
MPKAPHTLCFHLHNVGTCHVTGVGTCSPSLSPPHAPCLSFAANFDSSVRCSQLPMPVQVGDYLRFLVAVIIEQL